SACHLERHVGRGAEAVDPELAPRTHLAAPESPVADDTGAEQRGRLGVAEHGWNRVGERLGGHRVVGEATVGVIPSELGALAQVLAPAAARVAGSTRLSEPRDAHALARLEAPRAPADPLDAADDLMARHDRRADERQLAFDDVQVGTAHAARAHAHEDLVGRRRGHRASLEAERRGINRRRSRENQRRQYSWGTSKGPPNPPRSEPPRRSRGAPRFLNRRWGAPTWPPNPFRG